MRDINPMQCAIWYRGTDNEQWTIWCRTRTTKCELYGAEYKPRAVVYIIWDTGNEQWTIWTLKSIQVVWRGTWTTNSELSNVRQGPCTVVYLMRDMDSEQRGGLSDAGHGQRDTDPVQWTIWCGIWTANSGLSDAGHGQRHGLLSVDYLMRDMDSEQRTIWCETRTARHGPRTVDHLIRDPDNDIKKKLSVGYLMWDTNPVQWIIQTKPSQLSDSLIDL